MILNNAPQNEAIMSNVGEIGEFRIRNSAKAFSILSSGLYANKIKAIIRELSCNAVDSHVAAGKPEAQFDVHLPNSLEPWFSIRDFGTGLTHDQVTNIYTTYFESTKTTSNEFIGALGLGSKSPFSYTDNFTVTAIKDGVKGIYSAFINGEGVPSIAKMMEEQTDEPAGVEIKFSVNDRYDFDKFRQEATYVYRHFKLKPTVTGNANFRFDLLEYETRDIVPGVHTLKDGQRRKHSVAVMGNIAYPIDVPNPEKNLGTLVRLLNCGLEMEFGIGELDFQASREGLSYIPETINSIKTKLESLRDSLATYVKDEAEKIPNLWDRAIFLQEKHRHPLWETAVDKYATDTKLATYDAARYGRGKDFAIDVKDMAAHNIMLRGFSYHQGDRAVNNHNATKRYSNSYATYTEQWEIPVDKTSHFVINDTNVGASERAKYHYRNSGCDVSRRSVYVIEPLDRSKKVDTDWLFQQLIDFPKDRIKKASELEQKPRKDSSVGKNVTILKLAKRTSRYWNRDYEYVWETAQTLDKFDSKETHYYMPLSGFAVLSQFGISDIKQLRRAMDDCGLDSTKVAFYGVRKGDIETIKSMKNWVNIETYLANTLKTVDQNLLMNIAKASVDTTFSNADPELVRNILKQVQPTSPYAILMTALASVKKVEFDERSLKFLLNAYAKNTPFDPKVFAKKFVDDSAEISKRYPLMQYLTYNVPSGKIAEYINLIDKVGV